MPEKTFTVPNISCGHCTGTIEREIGELDGVMSVSADASTKMVTVKWDAPADWERIESVLNEINYPPA